MDSDENARALADRQAVTDLIYRYCRSVDRLDVPLGHSIWHEDGVADYDAFFNGSGRALIDLICAQHRQTLHHSHQISNILLELDGDRAGSEAYVNATLRSLRADGQLMQISVWGRYVDRWSRRDGVWGLDKRIAIRDFDELREVTEWQRYELGRRDRSDPSYAVLERGP